MTEIDDIAFEHGIKTLEGNLAKAKLVSTWVEAGKDVPSKYITEAIITYEKEVRYHDAAWLANMTGHNSWADSIYKKARDRTRYNAGIIGGGIGGILVAVLWAFSYNLSMQKSAEPDPVVEKSLQVPSHIAACFDAASSEFEQKIAEATEMLNPDDMNQTDGAIRLAREAADNYSIAMDKCTGD